jgi:tetratricopeptide (TPR) repeat protein
MSGSARIEELRRRIQLDPASIAFAALAEEYRRAGRYEETIATCRSGLRRHPSYLSARVTLGRALIDTGRYDEARGELEYVLQSAPENLAAIRGLAEIHDRLRESEAGRTDEKGGDERMAAPIAPPLSWIRAMPVAAPSAVTVTTRAAVIEPVRPEIPHVTPEAPSMAAEPAAAIAPALAGLEAFLASILRARRELDAALASSR